MKNFLKRNIVVIVIVLIFGSVFLYGDYQVIQNNQDIVELTNDLIERCEIEVITDEGEKKFCHEILTNEVIEPDFYSEFSEVLVWHVQSFTYFLFLIVIIPPMIQICKMLRNKYILNTNLRESYKSFIKKMLFTAYKYLWILPVLAIILMLPLLFTYTLTPEYSVVYGMEWSTKLIYYPILFIFLYLLNVLIVSTIYVNISLIVARFQKKFIPCIILSYIVFFRLKYFWRQLLECLFYKEYFIQNLE